MTDFNKWQLETLTPSWLRGPLGEGLALAFGHMKDAFAQAARQAVKARFPLLAPADALPALGADRILERYPPETESSYRARLVGAWEAWAKGGTPEGITDQLCLTGSLTPVYDGETLTSPRIRTPLHDGWPGIWATFWVIVTQPHLFAPPAILDGSWAYDGSMTWGYTNASAEQGQQLRRVVSRWKGAHARCADIVLIVSGEIYDGTWSYDGSVTYDSSVVTLPVA